MDKKSVLVKCLKLTTSNYDSEVVIAARKANEILKSLGKTWDEVVHIFPNGHASSPWADLGKKAPPKSSKQDDDMDYEDAFEYALRAVKSRSSTQRFVKSLHEWYTEYGWLTPKQKAAFENILDGLGY